SDAWAAAAGDHSLAVTGDVSATAPESDEGNNGRTEPITVAPLPPPPADPGFAYEDLDNDVVYDAGLDVPIPNATIRAGIYVVADPTRGLVIPASVGAISVTGRIDYRAGSAGHLVIGVDLPASDKVELAGGTYLNVSGVSVRSTAEKVELDASRILHAENAKITAAKKIDANVSGGVRANASVWRSENEWLDFSARAGATSDVYLLDANINTTKKVDVRAAGSIYAGRLNATSRDEHVAISSEDPPAGGRLSVVGATLAAHKKVELDAGTDMTLDDAVLTSTTEHVDLDTDTGSIYANRSEIRAYKTIEVTAYRDVSLDDANGTAETERLTVKWESGGASGTTTLRRATLTAYKEVEVKAKGGINATSANVTSTTDDIDLDADGGSLDLSNARLTSYRDVDVDAEGDVDVRSATLRSTVAKVELDAGAASRSLFVAGATFDDHPNDKAKAAPKGVAIVGTPASGTIDYNG
ncbi:MAG: hypothetical protein ACT4PT_08540, partial [Methanobacteriota archaeon]